MQKGEKGGKRASFVVEMPKVGRLVRNCWGKLYINGCFYNTIEMMIRRRSGERGRKRRKRRCGGGGSKGGWEGVVGSRGRGRMWDVE